MEWIISAARSFTRLHSIRLIWSFSLRGKCTFEYAMVSVLMFICECACVRLCVCLRNSRRIFVKHDVQILLFREIFVD
jgi:hypothetical protein